jgi:hypothetical protein
MPSDPCVSSEDKGDEVTTESLAMVDIHEGIQVLAGDSEYLQLDLCESNDSDDDASSVRSVDSVDVLEDEHNNPEPCTYQEEVTGEDQYIFPGSSVKVWMAVVMILSFITRHKLTKKNN